MTLSLTHFPHFPRPWENDPYMESCIDFNSCRMSVSESYVGKYTKQKLLGMGTFGEAWLVVSTVSGRWCLLV